MSLPKLLSQKVVIIGAGIVGVNLADELLSRGWSQVTVIEQGPLSMPGGSTSHAPGLVFQTNSSKTMSQLARYTVDKLLGLEKDGESCFSQIGGLEVATTTERLEELKRKHGWASSWGIQARLITPDECNQLYPLLNQKVVLGGLHIPSDGLAKANRAVQLLIERTSRSGVRYLGSTPVKGIETRGKRVTGVITPGQTTPADVVISCAGFWGVEIGKMVDLPVPLLPLAHQYVKTAPLPALGRRRNPHNGATLPILRHQDQQLYYREHGDRYGIGYYGHRPMPFNAGSLGPTSKHVDEHSQPSRLEFTPKDFGPAWKQSQALLPLLKESDIADGFNGVFSFTPDGAPLIGQAPHLDGFWVAEAVWVTHSAGVARALAQILTTGQSEIDMVECELSRFGEVQLSPEYVQETSAQNFREVYDIIHPWQPRSSPRGLRVSPFYSRQKQLGAYFVDAKAWERPEWYEANAKLVDHLPKRWQPVSRDAWSNRFYSLAVAVEAWKTRTAVVMFDLTSHCRLEVCGPGSVDLLQRLCTRNMDVSTTPPGTVVDALLLSNNGCIRGRVTIIRLSDEVFQLAVTSTIDFNYLSRQAHHQTRKCPSKWTQVRDISSGTCSVGLYGPLAAKVLSAITSNDSLTSLPHLQSTETFIKGIPITAIKITDIGSPGFELLTTASHGSRLWDTLFRAGQPHGLIAAGRVAYVSLRLEAGYRAFGIDVTSEHDPFEAGLEFAVDWSKRGGYVGYEALKERARGRLDRRLRLVSVDDGRSVVMGKEPVFVVRGSNTEEEEGGKAVGYIASAAFGYTHGRPIAHAWLPSSIAEGQGVEIEYFGRRVKATVVADPGGEGRGGEAGGESSILESGIGRTSKL